jgi:hypothetical protein
MAVAEIWTFEYVPTAVAVVILIVAVPGEAVSAEVAVIVTAAGLGATVGAEYSPVASIAPLPSPPVTDHVTVWLLPLFTTAVN